MRNFTMTEQVRDYAAARSSWPPDEVVERLRSTTQALGGVAGMQIGDDQGQLLTMMARLVGARRAVEVGTFTGYPSLCIARGLEEGCKQLPVVCTLESSTEL
jgi:caffeoyl-CoA O-methyltransferase